jgi:hypothetical protein
MSIQRYRSDGQGDCDLGGMYVLYADHVAALAEYRQQHDGISERYFQQIRNDALQEARDAVAALSTFAEANCNDSGDDWRVGRADGLRDALAAIDALAEGEQA